MPASLTDAPPRASSSLRRRGWEALAYFRDWQAYEAPTEPLYDRVQNRDVLQSELDRQLGSRPGTDLRRALAQSNIEAIANGRFSARGGPLYDVQQNGMGGRDVRREFGGHSRARLDDYQMGQRPGQRGGMDQLEDLLNRVRIAALQREEIARRAARENEWAREWELMERETMARIRREEDGYFRDGVAHNLRP
jgi:hypothetical protein